MESSSLIVVSNRLPFVVSQNFSGQWERKPSAGGLVTAVAPIVIRSGGFWVGWPGAQLPRHCPIPDSGPDDHSPTAGLKSDHVLPVALSPRDEKLFYTGMCNGTLWPIFHSMPSRAKIESDSWKSYQMINQTFAQSIFEALGTLNKKEPKKRIIIWIHDYHLFLVGQMVRDLAKENNVTCIIAFFLHIPFPSSDIFKIIPWSDKILEGMLGCDMIGFHDEDYSTNFMNNCAKEGLEIRSSHGKNVIITSEGRTVNVLDMPISIPYAEFKKMAYEGPRGILNEDIQVILGVDRLDYTKGLPNRLRAFEKLLEHYPEHKEKVELLQIAVPSRTDVEEYQSLTTCIEQLVGAINGKYSTSKWTPIKYLYHGVPHEELVSYYRDADICCLTPLRDGMNLVAKEFVACRVNKPGVLILSPFAGAGKHMKECLLANPYEISNVAGILHKALTMPEKERKLRMDGLRSREEENDVNVWMGKFEQAIQEIVESFPERNLNHNNVFESMLALLVKEKKHFMIMLDFDGTLAPIVAHPDLSELPEQTKNILHELKGLPKVNLAIISGRMLDDLKRKIDIPGITLGGSHGNVIEFPDGEKQINCRNEGNLNGLHRDLEKQIISGFPGAWIENKTFTICVHIRQVKTENQSEAKKLVELLAENHGLQTMVGHASIECQLKGLANKGTAVRHVLTKYFGPEWEDRTDLGLIYVGDDTTDEFAMEAIKGKGVSFRVVAGDAVATIADRALKSTRDVVQMLKWLINRIQDKSARNANDREKVEI